MADVKLVSESNQEVINDNMNLTGMNRKVCPGRIKLRDLIITIAFMVFMLIVFVAMAIIFTAVNKKDKLNDIPRNEWLKSEDGNVYYQLAVPYVTNPEEIYSSYSTMSIFVPSIYLNCIQVSGSDYYTCAPKTGSTGGTYRSEGAPIIVQINTKTYEACEPLTAYPSTDEFNNAVDAGFIVVIPAFRGIEAQSPNALCDLKSVVVFTKVEANNKVIPGNSSRIFAFGSGAGGALASMLGTSGTSSYYFYYIKDYGGLQTEDDDVFGVIAWNPYTHFDKGNEAYEWYFGLARDDTSRSNVAEKYKDFINGAKFYHPEKEDEEGEKIQLTLGNRDEFLSGDYFDYIVESLESSFIELMESEWTNKTIGGITYLNKDEFLANVSDYITYTEKVNETEATASINFTQFIKTTYKDTSKLKSFGAYDDVERSRNENYLFGLDGKPLHFDKTFGDLQGYGKEVDSDMKKKDSLDSKGATRLYMYTPLYFIHEAYEPGNTYIPKYWRIRKDVLSTDVPFNSEVNFYLTLAKEGKKADFKGVWGDGDMPEVDGDDNWVTWVKETIEADKKS